MTSRQEQFIEQIKPYALQIQKEFGVPASLAIAQAMLETDSGKKAVGNNYYGMKANKDWKGPSESAGTHEQNRNGLDYFTHAAFRAYEGLRDSVMNYGHVLAGKPRYSAVIHAANGYEAAEAVQKAGYATDKNYANKLKAIIHQYGLTQLDAPQFQRESDAAFESNIHRLDDAKKSHKGDWDKFVQTIGELFSSILGGILNMFGLGEDTNKSVAFANVNQNSIAMPNVPQKPRDPQANKAPSKA